VVHLVLMVTSHLTVLLLLLLDVLDEVLWGHLPRFIGHRAALVAESSSAEGTLDLEGRGACRTARVLRRVHDSGGVEVGSGEEPRQVTVLHRQVKVEVAVNVGGVVVVVVVAVIVVVVIVVVVAHHSRGGSCCLIESMSSGNNVLGEVEHMLGSVGRCHQISGVEVQVMQHLVRSLAS